MIVAATCLAMTLYHEARGEPVDGQLAVAEVVLNRVEDPRWPSTVCEVVEEPRQFASEGEVYELYKFFELFLLSIEVLEGSRDLLGIESTHFYSGSKKPFWAHKLEQDGSIGKHVFYTE